MLRAMRIAAGVVAVIAVVSVGAFLYFTRGIALPSEDVQASAEQLEVSDTTSQTLFRISQDDSQVEYNIYELLNGEDKTVVGATNEVAGDIVIDLNDLSQTSIGELSINARTFATDDERRDNAVARFILLSEEAANEFITFDGTIQEVTFDVTATLETAEQLVGHAEAIVQRSDFNLSIPEVPSVANVGDDVTLMIDFVANAVSEGDVVSAAS